MITDTMAVNSGGVQTAVRPADNIDVKRRNLQNNDVAQTGAAEQNEIQPEEMLNQIKSITEDGLYSVRFEKNQDFDELVVKIVDTETDEIIRQLPAEELLGLKKQLADLRGNIIDTTR